MKKVLKFIDGYKTYIGAWIVILCGFLAVFMAIYLKYDSSEFWDFMKFIFGIALAGVGLAVHGMRHAQKKTHDEVCELLGRSDRGRDPSGERGVRLKRRDGDI